MAGGRPKKEAGKKYVNARIYPVDRRAAGEVGGLLPEGRPAHVLG